MRNASRPSAAPTPLASDSYVEKQEQNTFTLIASALHASRHCQGRRILRQYDHLIADAKMPISHELSQNSGDQKPSVTGRPDQETWAAKLSATSEMGWLVAVALAFLPIHIATGIWLRPSADEATTSPREAISSSSWND
jgi:hypothetical protein